MPPVSALVGHLAASLVLAAAGLVSTAAKFASRPAKAAPSLLELVSEPGAGMAPIDALLSSPRRSLDVEVYELDDHRAEQILATDAARGVKVRVILDQKEKAENAAAFSYLSHHGVAVHWSSPRYERTHEKAVVVDQRVALVMTLNLTSRYYQSDRDFAVIDRDTNDVAAIEAVFSADWANRPIVEDEGEDLVWSPGATARLVGLIDGARHTLLVENEEMDDEAIEVALERAAERGVDVEVVMTAERSSDGAFDALERAGVHVATYQEDARLYIHAKAIVADPGTVLGRAFVGSENFSRSSLSYNRELGIETASPAVVSGLARVLRGDFAGAMSWQRASSA